MSDDSKPLEKHDADLVRLDYRVPTELAEDAQHRAAHHLATHRAAYEASSFTQFMPLIGKEHLMKGRLDANEVFFFGDHTVRPASGTLTFAAPEESDKLVATGQVTRKVVYRSATLDANIAVDKPTRKIELPPGSEMLNFARHIFSTEQVEDVFEAIVADYQHEYIEAMHRGADKRTLAALDRQYRLRYGLAFVRELGPVIWRVIIAIGVALKIAG
jgi:hypothetical protein